MEFGFQCILKSQDTSTACSIWPWVTFAGIVCMNHRSKLPIYVDNLCASCCLRQTAAGKQACSSCCCMLCDRFRTHLIGNLAYCLDHQPCLSLEESLSVPVSPCLSTQKPCVIHSQIESISNLLENNHIDTKLVSSILQKVLI
jgi:hypothetical protein